MNPLAAESNGASGRGLRPLRLMEMRSPHVEEALRRGAPAIIPTGSVEQHGAHLPFGTDTFTAELIAEGVAQRLGGYILPFTPLGVTPIHMGFPGTISLKPQTFAAILTDVCESVIAHGARHLIVINWHEGNIPALQMVASDIVRRTDARVILVQACYVAEELFGHEVGGLTHGGEIETLPVLLYNPSLVALEEARNSSERSLGEKMDRRRRSKGITVPVRDIREIAPTGWYGDPSPATEEKARRLFTALMDRIADDVRPLLRGE